MYGVRKIANNSSAVSVLPLYKEIGLATYLECLIFIAYIAGAVFSETAHIQ